MAKHALPTSKSYPSSFSVNLVRRRGWELVDLTSHHILDRWKLDVNGGPSSRSGARCIINVSHALQLVVQKN
jgi:hypothetical protein